MSFFFFFNDTATTEIYTLSLHDALPICSAGIGAPGPTEPWRRQRHPQSVRTPDRKSTRLNSSHSQISYAVFCLKKKKKKNINMIQISTQHTLLSFIIACDSHTPQESAQH